MCTYDVIYRPKVNTLLVEYRHGPLVIRSLRQELDASSTSLPFSNGKQWFFFSFIPLKDEAQFPKEGENDRIYLLLSAPSKASKPYA